MKGDLTPYQITVLRILLERQRVGRSITVTGAAAQIGENPLYVARAFTILRVKGYIAAIDYPHHRVVKNASGAPLGPKTFRRVAEDGVTVTQCPPRWAEGYGLPGFDQD